MIEYFCWPDRYSPMRAIILMNWLVLLGPFWFILYAVQIIFSKNCKQKVAAFTSRKLSMWFWTWYAKILLIFQVSWLTSSINNTVQYIKYLSNSYNYKYKPYDIDFHRKQKNAGLFRWQAIPFHRKYCKLSLSLVNKGGYFGRLFWLHILCNHCFFYWALEKLQKI